MERDSARRLTGCIRNESADLLRPTQSVFLRRAAPSVALGIPASTCRDRAGRRAPLEIAASTAQKFATTGRDYLMSYDWRGCPQPMRGLYVHSKSPACCCARASCGELGGHSRIPRSDSRRYYKLNGER